MSRFHFRCTRAIIAGALVTLAVSFASSAHAAASRDILWDIVSNCLDPAAADYCAKCRWPRPDTACAREAFCRQTTEVWAESNDYVALRDRKMCGCPEIFVHGLAIPKARVTGVDDPARPEGIWQFAWDLAVQRIGDGQDAALAVNPAATRAQDQLHVHIVRLLPDARQRFRKGQVSRVSRLDCVWKSAAKTAAAAGFDDYGVLVARHPEAGFIVVVSKESPEKAFVLERCK